MRKIWDFHGGIHPEENKHQSTGQPIAQAGTPPQLTLPMGQHIGAPATPIVAVGERVLKGQVVAEANGFVSVPVHAPTSGKVVAVEPRQVAHPSGLTALCVVIEPDGLEQWIEHSGVDDFRALDNDALLGRIRDAGIAGMGGAGFPAAVKLAGRPGAAIETLIINGTECEPYITADDILMRERADEIIGGALILQQLVQPNEVLIGIEDNKPEGLAAMRAAAEGTNLQIVEFPTKYPSGGEKQLIEILTGKQVPSGGLPADIGIVCQNIGSAVAIHRAVTSGEPLISRITTVTGEAIAEPRNYEVLLGTPMRWLLERAGYDPRNNRRLIMGGPMMGFTVASPDVPIVKTTNCLLAPTEQELPTPPPAQACIRCGMCAEACPASLLPQQMFWFAQGQEFEKLEQHNLFDCIECGACSYVCPSSIPLVQYYRAAKAEIQQQRRDTEKSNHSRDRFEARQARLERETAEKEAKRAARKQAAQERAQQAAADKTAGATESEDPIQAAIERAKAKKAAQQAGAQAPEANSTQQLKDTVESVRKRLDKAEQKLQAARETGDANVTAFETAVEKTRAKLAAAEQALAAAGGAEEPPASSGDAAGDAIARAMAARQAQADLSPQDKARADLEKLRGRLAKSEQRLVEAEQSGEQDKVLEALASTVERLRAKVAEAAAQVSEETEARAAMDTASADTAESAPSDDPAQAAIERARARRTAAANAPAQSAQEKLSANREAVIKKLGVTREKLEAARADGADTVAAFETAEQKLTEKLHKIDAELAELEDS